MELKIIILTILIIFLYICWSYINFENFLSVQDNEYINKIITWNVITLGYPERLKNIRTQENLLNIKINNFNATNGKNINQDNLINTNILDINFKFDSIKRSNEIGCYQSHLNLLKSLKKSQTKYHVILEDDFKFIPNLDILDIINKIIAQTSYYSFDIIFIGWTNDNNLSYTYFSDNLYKFNPNTHFYGAYAYIVNSTSLDKIINLITWIDMPIDLKYKQLYLEKKLDIYWTNPVIVEPNFSLPSTILSI